MRLGCFAYLESLVRTRSGPFTLSESITLEQFAAGVETSCIQHYAFPLDKALEQYPAFQLDAETVARIKHGSTFNHAVANNPGLARVYDTNGALKAIAEWSEERQAWRPKKVFASD
jgi:tRNA pseudouridine55 synthase